MFLLLTIPHELFGLVPFLLTWVAYRFRNDRDTNVAVVAWGCMFALAVIDLMIAGYYFFTFLGHIRIS
jgi:hypothetical protein